MVVVTHEMGFARHVSTHVIFLHQENRRRGRAGAVIWQPAKPSSATVP